MFRFKETIAIFCSDIVKKETVKTVMHITQFRNEYLEERKLC